MVADRVEQVGFAQSRAPVDEQRIVAAGAAVGVGVPGLLGHLECSGEGESVGVAHDVVVEGVAGVQA